MAGSDMLFDARCNIEEFIEQKTRGLLEDPMNEYQDPNWLQAAMLFEQTVIPCERYRKNHFLELAKNIVDKAGQHNNQVIYQKIPGMYNEKIIDPRMDLPDDVDVFNYDSLINTIKEWIEGCET
ncbi:hypothetical protein LCGC14_1441050 [marine sediment metagenome]|uniref:Uncharacterized protein n=1 Tax=marine sediment metagenome TaxID=412755 RepID=A0A0F9JLB6_9ZZZZ